MQELDPWLKSHGHHRPYRVFDGFNWSGSVSVIRENGEGADEVIFPANTMLIKVVGIDEQDSAKKWYVGTPDEAASLTKVRRKAVNVADQKYWNEVERLCTASPS